MENKMMNNETVMVISEKDFDSNLKFVSKIAEEAKNKGKAVLLRKIADKLIMCSGGVKASVAMVPVDVQGDASEWKGFVDGKDIIDKLSDSKSKNGRLEIRVNKEKSCLFLVNDVGVLPVDIDFVEDVVSAESAEDVIAKYRNEIVEKAYRIIRDIDSRGKIQLKHKDFLELGKSFVHTTYTIAGERCIEFRAFKEIQKVKRKIQDPVANVEREILVDEEFAIAEGIGLNNNRMSICRKYGLGIKIPEGLNEMKAILSYELITHVSSAISAISEEPIEISRGESEMCITAGKARFIFPVKDIEMHDIRPYFAIPYEWKISVNANELKSVVSFLTKCLDKDTKTIKVPKLNKMLIMPKKKQILFTGVGSNGLTVERYLSYEMATNGNGEVFRDFEVEEFDLGLQRKYIREFLDSSKSKEVSFGIHTYRGTGQNQAVQGLISIEDANLGVYGVHQRVKR